MWKEVGPVKKSKKNGEGEEKEILSLKLEGGKHILIRGVAVKWTKRARRAETKGRLLGNKPNCRLVSRKRRE